MFFTTRFSSVKHSVFVTSMLVLLFLLGCKYAVCLCGVCGMYKYVSIHRLICMYGGHGRRSGVLFYHSLPCHLSLGLLLTLELGL